MNNIKILVLGNMRHGKDSFAEILNEEFGIRFQSSSQASVDIFLLFFIAIPVFLLPRLLPRSLGGGGKLRASIIRKRLKGMDFLTGIWVRPAQS